MPHLIERIASGAEARLRSARRRWQPVDHICRAGIRYDEADAGRLAAATAYYGFFAVFALAVLGFVILGQVFRHNRLVTDTVSRYLLENLPQLNTAEVLQASGKVSIIAVIGLVLAGVGWIETLRSSQRALWRLDQHPGNPVIRRLVDLAVLMALGVLLMASIAVSAGLQDVVLRIVGEAEQSPLRVALRGWNTLIAGGVDLVLGTALLAAVPRLHLTLRRLLPSAALFAVGLWLLKTLGRWYITRTEHNPAYQLVAGTVGVLIFMYLLHQLLLFAAALAATSTYGSVRDLAGGRDLPDAVAAAAAHAAGSVELAAAATERAATAAAEAAQARAEQARAEQARAEQARAEQARAEQARAEPAALEEARPAVAATATASAVTATAATAGDVAPPLRNTG